MTSTPEECPTAISKVRPEMYRKYGRHDLRRFDHLADDAASLGTFHRGKMRVDCRFLFSKSKWGLYRGRPGGIIYLDLCFHEPKGYRISSATVRVTLDADSRELDDVRPGDRIFEPTSAVQMASEFGPKALVGPEKTVRETRGMKFSPQANFSFGGVGFGDVSKESESTVSCRWTLRGHMVTDGWKYDALEWELTENDLERQSTHSNLVHTAFTIRHDRQPFFLKVDVDAKLRGARRELRSKLSSFRASTKKSDAPAVTLVKFGRRQVFSEPLDDHAKSLCLAMERENLNEVIVEVPDPMPVTYHSVSPSAPSQASESEVETLQPTATRHHISMGGVQAVRQYDQVLGRQQHQQMLGQETRGLEHDKTSPTTANLIGLLHADLGPRESEPPPRAQHQEECESAPTCVENVPVSAQTAQDKVVPMSYLSAYLVLMQLLAILKEIRFLMASKLLGAPPTQVKALFDTPGSTPAAPGTAGKGGLARENKDMGS